MYADYGFYRGEFHGQLPPDEYERLAVAAGVYLDAITFGRAANVTEEAVLRRVKLAECAAVDAMRKNEQGGGIASETVGKYSVNYLAGLSTAGTDQSRLYEAVRPYLAGTGLCYRGV